MHASQRGEPREAVSSTINSDTVTFSRRRDGNTGRKSLWPTDDEGVNVMFHFGFPGRRPDSAETKGEITSLSFRKKT